MTQVAKVIDVTRSFLPIDPNSMPENMMWPAQEDTPEKTLPIVGFEGYNFLPTPYGYKSYFGTSKLDVADLPARCDKVLLFQLSNYKNILIALAEDGVYYNTGDSTSSPWVVGITSSLPPAGTYVPWSYTLIENTLYFYRQGEPQYYTLDATVITVEEYSYLAVVARLAYPPFIAPTSGSGINSDPFVYTLDGVGTSRNIQLSNINSRNIPDRSITVHVSFVQPAMAEITEFQVDILNGVDESVLSTEMIPSDPSGIFSFSRVVPFPGSIRINIPPGIAWLLNVYIYAVATQDAQVVQRLPEGTVASGFISPPLDTPVTGAGTIQSPYTCADTNGRLPEFFPAQDGDYIATFTMFEDENSASWYLRDLAGNFISQAPISNGVETVVRVPKGQILYYDVWGNVVSIDSLVFTKP